MLEGGTTQNEVVKAPEVNKEMEEPTQDKLELNGQT